jgi:hypothetical protein
MSQWLVNLLSLAHFCLMWSKMWWKLVLILLCWRFFLVEHTNALDRAVIRNQLAETPSTGRSNRLGGRSNRLGQERRPKPRFAAPGGTPSGTVRLGLSWDQQATQNSLNRRGDEGGEKRRLEKLGFGENKIKLDNDDWMIGLNRPRPFRFIGWEVLPWKQ